MSTRISRKGAQSLLYDSRENLLQSMADGKNSIWTVHTLSHPGFNFMISFRTNCLENNHQLLNIRITLSKKSSKEKSVHLWSNLKYFTQTKESIYRNILYTPSPYSKEENMKVAAPSLNKHKNAMSHRKKTLACPNSTILNKLPSFIFKQLYV